MRISDWSSDVCSSDLRHISEAAAQAEADAADPVSALAAQPADRRFDILDAQVGVILSEIAECFLEFRLDVGMRLDAGGDTPDAVRGGGQHALGLPVVALLSSARTRAGSVGQSEEPAGE